MLNTAIRVGDIPSAVATASVDGVRWPVVALGAAQLFDDGGLLLPPERRIPARADTWYDLASVSKIVTAIAVLALVDRGVLDLDRPVAGLLPEFAAGAGSVGKDSITIRHLLSHTSGLPGSWFGWRALGPGLVPGDRAATLEAILRSPLTAAPATAFAYSCLGYVAAMAVAERATGERWDDLVRDLVLDRLPPGIGFRPPAALAAATEYQPELGRGMVRGTVHDETAAALDGISGNAGLFATVEGLRGLGEALLARLPGILSAPAAAELTRNQLPGILPAKAVSEASFGQGLGLRIGEPWAGPAGSDVLSHTGFTGPAVLVDFRRRLVGVLLCNRVHPTRNTSDAAALRSRLVRALYDGMDSLAADTL